mgnify:CR=1 FL=1
MATKTINVDMLAKMFLAGAQNIEAKKEFINELNVFPVPDGDTGTNMSLTIMAAAKEVTSLQNPKMADLAKAISSGSLRGARGNSGVILSQLLRGFTKAIREEKEIDVIALAAACNRARETAYKAVMKPKEGTILTVASGIAEKASEMAQETDERCLALLKDYESLIRRIGSKEAITRRFFIIFEYEPFNGSRNTDEGDARSALATAVQTAKTYLQQCGNEILMPDNEDELATDVLYNLLNRRTSAIKPLPTRINEVIGQYINAGRKNDLDHIPAGEFFATGIT